MSGGIKISDKFNTGIDFRYQHTLAYDDYFNEPSNYLGPERAALTNRLRQLRGGPAHSRPS